MHLCNLSELLLYLAQIAKFISLSFILGVVVFVLFFVVVVFVLFVCLFVFFFFCFFFVLFFLLLFCFCFFISSAHLRVCECFYTGMSDVSCITY